jgi:hypothetical protein
MAGPLSPQNNFESAGLKLSTSILAALIVFITETASAPAMMHSYATFEISGAWGVNLADRNLDVIFLTLFTTNDESSGEVPNCSPPAQTLGQDMFIS